MVPPPHATSICGARSPPAPFLAPARPNSPPLGAVQHSRRLATHRRRGRERIWQDPHTAQTAGLLQQAPPRASTRSRCARYVCGSRVFGGVHPLLSGVSGGHAPPESHGCCACASRSLSVAARGRLRCQGLAAAAACGARWKVDPRQVAMGPTARARAGHGSPSSGARPCTLGVADLVPAPK